MSYDIFAFNTDAVGAEGVLAWFAEQGQWSEPHSYDDPAVTTPELRALYRDLITVFPPLNGPDAGDDGDTDYCIGTDIVYVSFRWARADEARDIFIRLGLEHGLGICEISESPAVLHRPAAAATAGSGAGPSRQAHPAPQVATAEAATQPAPDHTAGTGEGRLYL